MYTLSYDANKYIVHTCLKEGVLNTAKPHRQVLQYFNTESKLDVIPKPLLCMLSLEQSNS